MIDSEFEPLFARADDVCSQLKAVARPDVEALLACAREVMSGAELGGVAVDPGRGLVLKKRLGALVERVARRDAQAMPFAALGRAALATLNHADNDAKTLLHEFESKLTMLGM